MTYQLTMGVVKNIIPAIASTNALISAACVNEVIKILSGCNNTLKNYMQYTGQTGVNTVTFESERLDDCLVCKLEHANFKITKDQKLQEVINHFMTTKNLVGPGINPINQQTLYASGGLAAMHKHKLDLTIGEL